MPFVVQRVQRFMPRLPADPCYRFGAESAKQWSFDMKRLYARFVLWMNRPQMVERLQSAAGIDAAFLA